MSEPTVFNGRYELHRKLARGGMADVFLARDQLLDRPVAVKVLFREFATDPSFVARFRREAQAAANLNHPNIVSVYDWGQEAGTYFIVMEYVEGRSLAEIIRSEGPLHPDRAAEVATDIAAALGFAHRNGVVHRDVKPGNVLISPTGQVKVADFGIARAVDASTEENLTQTGSVMGTATYFSPEQAQGLPLDPRSDLYSVGVVLYEMLTGRPPFSGDSPVAIAYKHVQEQPAPVRGRNLDVPPDLEAVTHKLLAKNPANRYASAEDLRADLRRFREGQAVLATGGSAVVGGATAVQAAAGATQAMPSTRVVRTYSDGTQSLPMHEGGSGYPPQRRTGAFLAVLIVLLLVLAALLVLLARTLGVGDNNGVEQVAVPSVLGQPVDQATATLETQGFEVDRVEEKNEDTAVGIVFGQSPQGGERIDEGSSVTIRVSSGADTVAMPDLTGQQETDARRLLTSQGFTNITSEQQADDEVDVGEVVGQEPPAGTQVAKDSPIVLSVSSGPEAVEVPDVSGRSATEASNVLGRAGFAVEQSEESSGSVDEGNVIRTDPPAGSELPRGETVTIVVSSGGRSVPDVLGDTQGAAVAELEGAGYDVDVVNEPVPPGDDRNGTVIEQSPEGGTELDQGETVTIFVAEEIGDGDGD